MSKRLEYFFDYVSPFSYLADSQVPALVSRTGAELVYRPFFLGGVMQAAGNTPPLAVPNKGRYMLKDIERWRARYGLELKFNPHFPVSTLNAMRGAIVALEEGSFADYHPALFRAVWLEGRDVGDKAVLGEVATAAGIDAERLLAGIGEQRIKDALRANTEEAVERGAFGAPSFFVEGELFFGNDRLDFLEEALGA